jgi:multiple sugar transport system substrate-binding protein
VSAKAAAWGAVGAAALVGVAAYGERVVSRDAASARTTVVYWEKWTGAEADEMRKVVDAFNRSQDRILVKYLSISGVDQKTMLATAGGNPPDVAGIWDNQVFQFADLGALTDLTELAAAGGLTRDNYIHAYYDALSDGRRLWALPSTPASLALHVRPDLVPPEVATPETFPKTFEGLDALLDRVSKVNANGGIERASFLPSNPGWWNWAWPQFFGGEIMRDGRPTLDTPEARAAFDWILKYSKKFGAQSVQNFQSGFGNFSSPQDPFMQGKVASEMNGTWKANYIKVYKADTPWFAVPFPYPESRPDLAGHTVATQDVLVIPRGAKHVKEAFEFIRFMQRQDVMEGLCSGHGKNSPLAKVSERFFAHHPNKEIRLFDALARSPKAFYPARTGLFPQISNELGNAFQEVNTQSKTPAQALRDAQRRIDGLWRVYVEQVKGA